MYGPGYAEVLITNHPGQESVFTDTENLACSARPTPRGSLKVLGQDGDIRATVKGYIIA
jgi:hypothetical protein